MRIMFLSKIRLCVRENPLVNWACAVLVDNDMVQSCFRGRREAGVRRDGIEMHRCRAYLGAECVQVVDASNSGDTRTFLKRARTKTKGQTSPAGSMRFTTPTTTAGSGASRRRAVQPTFAYECDKKRGQVRAKKLRSLPHLLPFFNAAGSINEPMRR